MVRRTRPSCERFTGFLDCNSIDFSSLSIAGNDYREWEPWNGIFSDECQCPYDAPEGLEDVGEEDVNLIFMLSFIYTEQ